MPEGLPTASDLMEHRAVTFFSIDTDVIQSLGYKFKEGALNALHFQCPIWMEMHLTEVVEREVMDHRMTPVINAIQDLKSSMSKVNRLTGYDLSEVEKGINEVDLETLAHIKFNGEFVDFYKELRGSVLPIDGPNLARKMFSMYFSEYPPFEARKEKKSEFPDAAALLILEDFSEKNNTHGILISKDAGWLDFAKKSKSLYCVKSLEEFVALFESKGKNADRIKEIIKSILTNEDSDFFYELERSLSNQVGGASWNFKDLYSGYGLRVEADLDDVAYNSSVFDLENLSIWFVEHDPSVCTVEVPASVSVTLNINIDFYQYDAVDKEEIAAASNNIFKKVTVDVDVFLICRGNLLEDEVDEWRVDIGTSGDDYRIDIGEVNPSFRDEWD